MLTRWGRELDPDHPLPEYPRPQLTRAAESWQSLNGRWQYAITPADRRGHPETWDGEIVVPFSPETELSGVGRRLGPAEFLWYRRRFTPPEHTTGDRVLLHFGAVDQSCVVRVDGVRVGEHVGGYLPFTLDITDAVGDRPEAELTVRARDLTEQGPHARGKQRLDAGGIWYTAQSGIWQSVWTEVVPSSYVEGLRIVAELPDAAFLVTVLAAGPDAGTARVVLRADGRVLGEAAGPAGIPLRIPVPDPRPWSPADPFLYDLDVTLGRDRVGSYAALRTFGTGVDAEGRRRFLLNGAPFQHVGILDQGYWPDGLLTAPSDAAMVHDLTLMKELGFTMVRKHVKIEPLRWYHHCDRIGLLVWQDLVNGGGRYRHLVTELPARRRVPVPDRWYRLYFREDAAARAEFRTEVRRTVELLGNAPSVAVWTPFNEGWGQFDAAAIAAEIKALDPTRPVNHVSGWIDQGGGDIKSFHSYLRPFRLRQRRRERRVLALTEYGGHSLAVPGHAPTSDTVGYHRHESAEDLAAAFVALHRDQIEPAVAAGLAATVYTQFSDVESELNGLLTWDREVLKIPATTIRTTLARLTPDR